MKYTVIIEEAEDGYGAYAPDLPGCVATAKTRAEVLEQIKGAIEFHLEGLKADGEPVPHPHCEITEIEVDAA
jgi:predicted RNase H-like HicB family nuclease